MVSFDEERLILGGNPMLIAWTSFLVDKCSGKLKFTTNLDVWQSNVIEIRLGKGRMLLRNNQLKGLAQITSDLL